MANKLIPLLLILMFPLDLLAGLLHRTYPTQATFMSLVGFIIGVTLARRLWLGGAEKLEAQARFELVSELGPFFDPDSEEAQLRLANARVNRVLGGGLIGLGLLFNICFIASYLVVVPISTTPTMAGTSVQLAVLLLFNLLVSLVEGLGAKVFFRH